MAKVKVRIAVAVGADGKWCSAGWHDSTDDELMGNAVDGTSDGATAEYFVTAELDVPEVKEIAAKAEKAKSSR